MHVKRALFLLMALLVLSAGLPLLTAACAPAVPWNEMPGNDLYGGANSSRMTANAALQQAQWAEQAMTGTAQAGIVPMTQAAAAVTIEAAHAEATRTAGASTQAAAMTSTAIWWTPTPNINSTATIAKLNADNTAIANALERDRLQLEREQTMNDFNAKVSAYSWVIVVLVVALVLMWITRRMRFQPAKVDARGNVIPVLDIVEGTVTDIDRNPNFKGSMKNDWLIKLAAYWFEKRTGAKLLLPEVTAQRQDLVTYRDQLLDLATRGLPAPPKSEDARKAKVGEMMTQPQLTSPVVQPVTPEFVKPILRDVVPQIAKDSIEAELIEQKNEEGVT